MAADPDWIIYQQPQWSGIDYSRNHLLFTGSIISDCTLPVEFNASRRAVRILGETGILGEQELGYTRKVLGAAALTYVAGAASAILQLLRLILLFGGRRDD
nr:zinc metallopeptidase [Roseburia sp. AF25-25LB]